MQENYHVYKIVKSVTVCKYELARSARSRGPAAGESKVTAKSSRSSRWYREPVVWMVLAIPASAVVAGAVVLALASMTWDGLVADDYYERGMQISRSLARDEEAARLGIGATLAFPSPGAVEVRLSGGAATYDGEPVSLRFARAAQAGADVRIRLNRDAGDVWRGNLPALLPGKWYVELGTERWRLTAPLRTPVSAEEAVVIESPAP